MPNKMQNIECSVVVCTYEPVWEKLRLTLKSILLQDDCNFQIVVTDDGSKENCFDMIRDYFANCSFSNYELIASPENHGTTKNILQGVYASVGELVKPLSPGDFLHGRHALRKWIDFMCEHKDCIMTFCDALYYHMKKGKILVTKEYAHPQKANDVLKNISVRDYLLFNDICLGAATMVRRKLWLKYLEMIAGKVVYAEDNSYRIMIYCGEKFAYLPNSFLLYDYGCGVSTSGDDIWKELLHKDWKSANDIMLEMIPCHEADCLHIREFIRAYGKNDWLTYLRCWKSIPVRYYYKLKYKFFPRKTSTNLDDEFINELLK